MHPSEAIVLPFPDLCETGMIATAPLLFACYGGVGNLEYDATCCANVVTGRASQSGESVPSCIDRLKTTLSKTDREATLDCCEMDLERQMMPPLLAREQCCVQTRMQFEQETELCSREVCYFERVESEVGELQRQFVQANLANVVMTPEEALTRTILLDGLLGQYLETEITKQKARQDALAAAGNDIPWSQFVDQLVYDFLQSVTINVFEETETDLNFSRLTLEDKYRLLFILVQSMGVVYDSSPEIIHREQRLQAWNNGLQWTDSQQFALGNVKISSENLPLSSPLDLFMERQRLRKKIADTPPVARRSQTTKKMCRQSSIGRPSDDNLMYQQSNWRKNQLRWQNEAILPFSTELRAWRSVFLYTSKQEETRIREKMAKKQEEQQQQQ